MTPALEELLAARARAAEAAAEVAAARGRFDADGSATSLEALFAAEHRLRVARAYLGRARRLHERQVSREMDLLAARPLSDVRFARRLLARLEEPRRPGESVGGAVRRVLREEMARRAREIVRVALAEVWS
jgi:hypothetical protein